MASTGLQMHLGRIPQPESRVATLRSLMTVKAIGSLLSQTDHRFSHFYTTSGVPRERGWGTRPGGSPSRPVGKLTIPHARRGGVRPGESVVTACSNASGAPAKGEPDAAPFLRRRAKQPRVWAGWLGGEQQSSHRRASCIADERSVVAGRQSGRLLSSRWAGGPGMVAHPRTIIMTSRQVMEYVRDREPSCLTPKWKPPPTT